MKVDLLDLLASQIVEKKQPFKKTIRKLMSKVVEKTLIETRGNQTETARILGLNRTSVRQYIDEAKEEKDKDIRLGVGDGD